MTEKDKEYSILKSCFIFTFILGFFAYGYVFTNFTPAHDGIMTVTNDQAWQTAIGRALMQYYVRIRGVVDAPWLIGCLTLLYTAMAVYLTVKVLGIDDEPWNIFVVSSVYTLNITYICSATVYIYLLDIYATALLLAVAAVWTYGKEYNKIVQIAVSGVLLSLSMGLYQSYFAVAIALFIILFIQKVLSGESSLKELLLNAFEMLCVAEIGAILYSVTLKIVQKVTNVQPYDSYNSVSKLSDLSVMGIISSIPGCYKGFYNFFFKNQPYANTAFMVVNILLVVLAAIMYGYCFVKCKKTINKVFLLLAICLFPLGANCIYILTGGMLHYLMVFSYQIFYLLLLFPLLNGDFKMGGGTHKARGYCICGNIVSDCNQVF